MQKGYVQVYTGNGKGKTTAALGLTLRAVGAGLRVYIGQFLKNLVYSEIHALEKYLPGVVTEQFGYGECFVHRDTVTGDDLLSAKHGLERGLLAMTSGEFDVVIMDEINVAAFMGVIAENDILDLIDKKPDNVELILTGRYAPQSVIEKADLVTEMAEIKHYYNDGIEAREGIEK